MEPYWSSISRNVNACISLWRQAAKIVAGNLDMVNFRCDWVKFSSPLITRGNDSATTNWVEIIHLSAFVSYATN